MTEIKVRIADRDLKCHCCGAILHIGYEYYWIQKLVQGMRPNKTIGPIVTYLRYCPGCKEATYGD